jgi:hypothetical protein
MGEFFYKGIFFKKLIDQVDRVMPTEHHVGHKYESIKRAWQLIMSVADGIGVSVEDLSYLWVGGFSVAHFFSEQYGKCPYCEADLEIHKVNHAPCTQVGGDYEYLICCADTLTPCDFEMYVKNLEQPWEILEEAKEDEWHPPVQYKEKKPCGGCGGQKNG